MQCVVISDIDYCGDLVEECEPSGYDAWLPREKVVYWQDVQEEIESHDTYRFYELLAFYSQLLAIVIYIVYSKLFLVAKRRLGTFDKSDPFQLILADRNQDFLENENYFMVMLVV